MIVAWDFTAEISGSYENVARNGGEKSYATRSTGSRSSRRKSQMNLKKGPIITSVNFLATNALRGHAPTTSE